jgi:tetratricopeptide (TPR) repeat protein
VNPEQFPRSETAVREGDQATTLAGTLEPSPAAIGPYRIEGRIGGGGMGTVFVATDERLRRRVAIKAITRDGLRDSAAMLVQREARAIARLSHPNIASVFDIVDHDGSTYIVMEYLDGETLASRLRRGPLTLPNLLAIATQIAAGLAHAHRQSIIHCDLKPANVFVVADGTVKLLDFGLARVIDAETDEESGHVGASPTLIRQRAGTPGYMSPEHRRGEPLDTRSDVYSLGVVLHEMATGCKPPSTASGGPPRERELGAIDAAVPAALQSIIARALAPDPKHRPASAAEVESALREARVASSGLWPATGGRRLAAAVALVGALVAALFAWNTLADRTPGPGEGRPVIAVLPFTAGEDASAGYLAAGLTEIVTNDLSGYDDLVVVSNSTVRSARAGDRTAPARLAAELGASHLVLGQLNSDAQQLHIQLQLFTAASGLTTSLGRVDASFAEVVGDKRQIAATIRARFSEIGLVDRSTAAAASSAPSDPRALEEYARGREYVTRQDPSGENLDIALTLLESAVRREPQFALAHAAISDAAWRKYRRTRDTSWATRAQTSAFDAMRLAPNESQVRYTAAIVLNGTGRTREAIEEATRAIALRPTNDEAHRLLGRLYADSGEMDQAIRAFNTAIQLRPGAWESYHSLGLACFDAGRYAEAIAAFTRETELRPDSASPFQALGTSYHAIGDLARALANYERAIAIAPSAFSYSNIGMLHYAQGRFHDAVVAYERSVALAPNEPVTHRNLGDSLLRAGDTARARASYREAIRLAANDLAVNPNDGRLIALQAVCYAKLDDRSAAIQAVKSALAIAPPDNDVLFKSAVTMALLGDPDQSMALLKDAISGGYSRALAAEDSDLTTLRHRDDFKALVAAAGK